MHLAIRGIAETFGGLNFSAYHLADRVELCGVVFERSRAVIRQHYRTLRQGMEDRPGSALEGCDLSKIRGDHVKLS
jgi:hypothetical protein